jgi:hypothetical protein
MFGKKYSYDELHDFMERSDRHRREMRHEIDQLKQGLNQAIRFIPASYEVEEITRQKFNKSIGQFVPELEVIGWTVVKNHPILGKSVSQPFPTKGCAEKALKEHFDLLQFDGGYRL